MCPSRLWVNLFGSAANVVRIANLLKRPHGVLTAAARHFQRASKLTSRSAGTETKLGPVDEAARHYKTWFRRRLHVRETEPPGTQFHRRCRLEHPTRRGYPLHLTCTIKSPTSWSSTPNSPYQARGVSRHGGWWDSDIHRRSKVQDCLRRNEAINMNLSWSLMLWKMWSS